jgi:pimeloyl-ACP methyl ester carboxylesterase
MKMLRALGLIVVVGVLVAVLLAVGATLVRRRDRRRSGPPTGLADPVPALEQNTVTTDDGASLHVVEVGAGPPVVLVHGLSLDHRSWNYQLTDLADRCRLIALDLRGHGSSTLGSEPIGPHRFASDLAEVLVRLDLRDAVVVGHSLGGTVVGQLCADHPALVRERIAGVVFVGTFASAIAGEGRFREAVSPTLVRVTSKMRLRAKPRDRAPSGAVAYAMARTSFGQNPQPEHVDFMLEVGSATPPSVVSAATLANLAYDVRAGLRTLEVPTLVVRGDRDTLSTERSAAQLQRSLPNTELVLFEGCGHLPMLEDRHRFSEVLGDFVARATSRR